MIEPVSLSGGSRQAAHRMNNDLRYGRMATLQRTPGVRSVIEIQGVPVGDTKMAYPKHGSSFGSTVGSTDPENPSKHGEEGC